MRRHAYRRPRVRDPWPGRVGRGHARKSALRVPPLRVGDRRWPRLAARGGQPRRAPCARGDASRCRDAGLPRSAVLHESRAYRLATQGRAAPWAAHPRARVRRPVARPASLSRRPRRAHGGGANAARTARVRRRSRRPKDEPLRARLGRRDLRRGRVRERDRLALSALARQDPQLPARPRRAAALAPRPARRAPLEPAVRGARARRRSPRGERASSGRSSRRTAAAPGRRPPTRPRRAYRWATSGRSGSSRPSRASGRATPRRSRRRCSTGSSARCRARATWCSTPTRAAGTTLAVAYRAGRAVLGIDAGPLAIRTTRARMAALGALGAASAARAPSAWRAAPAAVPTSA